MVTAGYSPAARPPGAGAVLRAMAIILVNLRCPTVSHCVTGNEAQEPDGCTLSYRMDSPEVCVSKEADLCYISLSKLSWEHLWTQENYCLSSWFDGTSPQHTLSLFNLSVFPTISRHTVTVKTPQGSHSIKSLHAMYFGSKRICYYNHVDLPLLVVLNVQEHSWS